MKYTVDFKIALIVEVNHDGDSDKTVTFSGDIHGAYSGIGNIPEDSSINDELMMFLSKLLMI
ncbi:hypothetical protein KHA93_00630 [Bacillus sp. FJAT-49732]|uniref:Uncharacterized protein n=1 Tax=Lederbergia citrisecunda TaxID=2833583 RepID=A0A942TJC9_9BACI|nr:hypothetical protein [Lederbergia citrisecunda]